MAHTMLIHLLNDEPVVGEVERLPEPTDQVLIVTGVRKLDGHPVSFLQPDVGTVIFPWARIQCVELMGGEAEEEIISFIKE